MKIVKFVYWAIWRYAGWWYCSKVIIREIRLSHRAYWAIWRWTGWLYCSKEKVGVKSDSCELIFGISGCWVIGEEDWQMEKLADGIGKWLLKFLSRMGSQRFCEVIINSFLSRISSQWLRGTINSFLSSNVKVNRWLSLGGCHWISRWLSWGGYCCVSRWLSWGGCCWVSGWLSWGSCCWISRWLSWGGCCWVSRWLKYSVAKMYSEQTMASKCSNSLLSSRYVE